MVEKIEINLIPHEYRVRSKRFTIKKDVLIPVVISGVLITTAVMWNAILVGRIKNAESATARIESEIAANSTIKQEIENLEVEQQAMERKIAGLKQVSVVRDKWVRLLELYCMEIPENSWLTEIKEEGPSVKITGETMAFGEVGQFMVQLMNNPLVSSVSLVEVKGKDATGSLLTFTINQGLHASMLPKTPAPAADSTQQAAADTTQKTN